MRIGIDISQAVYGTGVSDYTRNLVKALLQLNKENEFVLFGGSLRRFRRLKAMVNDYRVGRVLAKILPVPPTVAHILWNRLHVLPIELFTGPLDVFHSSDWTQPPTRAYKVTTVHDLAPLRFPDVTPPQVVEAHKLRLQWVKKEVDKIIAVSTFTKREIVELLGIDPEKIVVIPEAADPSVRPLPNARVEPVLKRFGVDTDYLLVVGTDPRKNLPAVIQAFGRIRKVSDLSLVVAGRQCGQLPEGAGVIAVGHVTRQELSGLYSGALALIYTSIYEGFGLPILEAMQAGCPVVTSNVSSMPEVAGGAAVLVDPLSSSAIAKGIEEVLSDRQKWVVKGKSRAKEFSWEYTAKLTLRVYKEAEKR